MGILHNQPGLAKTIIQGTVQGGRRGRQEKMGQHLRVTGLKLSNTIKLSENGWRKLAVRSSVVLQLLARLRNR